MLKPRGTLRVEGKENSQFPLRPVIKCYVIHVPTQNKTIHECQLTTLLQNVTDPSNLHIK